MTVAASVDLVAKEGQVDLVTKTPAKSDNALKTAACLAPVCSLLKTPPGLGKKSRVLHLLHLTVHFPMTNIKYL